MSVKTLLTVSSLSFSYTDRNILENVSFDIKENDFIALIGPNGSGKTTLAKLLLGLLDPTEGKIDYNIPKNKMGYTPQRYSIDKNFPGTVAEIVSSKNKYTQKVGIRGLLHKKFVNLSGGQQQRVLIALALEQDPKLLILDEPTAGVDIKAQKSFYALLKTLNEQGIAIILVTHEVGVISKLVKNVLCINHKICCMDQPKKIPQLLKQMYGEQIVQHHHKHGGHHHD